VQGVFVAHSSTSDTPSYRGQGYFTYNEGYDVSWFMGTPYTNGDFFCINRQHSTTSFDTAAAYIGNANTDNFFSITNTGKVGIGTTSPSSKLSISGLQAAIDITRGTAGDSKWEFSSDSTALYFSETSTGTPAYMMTIKETTGNVGIGTTGPAGKVQIVNNSQSTAALTVCNELNGGSGFVFQRWQYVESTTNFKLDLVQRVSSGVVQYAFDMVNGGTGYTSVLVLDRGKVGIGTTSPTYKLHVISSNNVSIFEDTSGSSGAAFCVFNVPGAFAVGSITRNGTTNSISFNTGSDYRLKEDLQDFNALDLVDNITAYNYKWKNTEQRDYGFVAHELQEVMPNVVTGEKDGEKMQSVDYSKLTPVLLKAIQEQQEIINDLKSRIETLENK
jgi:hypothetical protein